MEELGSIEINVNERGVGGFGGGKGDIGQGPRIPQPPVHSVTTAGFLKDGLKGIYPEKAIDSMGNLSLSINSLRETLRRPTTSGVGDLLRKDGILGKSLSGMGAAGARAATGLLAAGAAAGALTLAYGFASETMQKIAERSSEIGRFSGPIISAQVNESIAKMGRNMAEASKNGAVYARALRAQTVNSDIYASVMADLSAAGSVLATGLTNLGTLMLYILKPVTAAIGGIARAMVAIADWLDENVLPKVKAIIERVASAIADFLEGLSLGLMAMGFGQYASGLEVVVQWLRQINKDQNKQKTNPVNDWFLGDVKAMTGNDYSRINAGVTT